MNQGSPKLLTQLSVLAVPRPQLPFSTLSLSVP